jgi:hypothetical protein
VCKSRSRGKGRASSKSQGIIADRPSGVNVGKAAQNGTNRRIADMR